MYFVQYVIILVTYYSTVQSITIPETNFLPKDSPFKSPSSCQPHFLNGPCRSLTGFRIAPCKGNVPMYCAVKSRHHLQYCIVLPITVVPITHSSIWPTMSSLFGSQDSFAFELCDQPGQFERTQRERRKLLEPRLEKPLDRMLSRNRPLKSEDTSIMISVNDRD